MNGKAILNTRKGSKEAKRWRTGTPALASKASQANTAATWLFTKTRVSVATLFGNLAAGATVEQFLDWFEGVEEWQVRAALKHVADNIDAKIAHENPVWP